MSLEIVHTPKIFVILFLKNCSHINASRFHYLLDITFINEMLSEL